MSDAPPGQNGDRRSAPRLPTGLIAASVAIALLAVSGLIYLLYRATRGPGEILRRFAGAVDAQDCPASYDLLHDEVRAEIGQESWCGALPSVDAQIDSGFTLERAVLEGDVARVEIAGAQETTWELGRHGDRSWRVLGPEGGVALDAPG